MRPAISYTALRLGLFVVVFGLLWVAGARSLLLLVLATVVSAVLSYFVLSSQRSAMAGVINRRVGAFKQQLDQGTRAEDDD
jgi:hypothetical protein